MVQSAVNDLPNRVTDLIGMIEKGLDVTCQTSFEILSVDFAHRANPFRAYIFLCRYEGTIDGQEYSFRKCYARGCPHNLCPHVSQAIMIANRYLQRDYRRLERSGIEVDKKMFTLEDMIVKFNGYHEEHGPILTIHDYINIAKEGNEVFIDVFIEYVPAVEHFSNYENKQTFLMVDFTVTTLGRSGHSERCLACYSTDEEKKESQIAIMVANERLKLLYQEFDDASIIYEKCFFE
ncbi:MAG: hypothetical protein P8012_03675 [Desulfobacterales bacterium]